ncbi:MAG: hypothetical protein AAFX06_32910 [Planctomycetota bacterium]
MRPKQDHSANPILIMKCKWLVDGKCEIVHRLSGQHVEPHHTACTACSNQGLPQAENFVTGHLAFGALTKAKQAVPRKVITLAQLDQVSEADLVPSTIPQVGSVLKEKFAAYKKPRGDCGCMKDLREMNLQGVAGVMERLDEWTERIAKKTKWFVRPLAKTIIRSKIQEAIDACRMSVVWVYWAGGADGDELRYSIRSAAANLTDARDFHICGDVPEWFTGGAIHSPRFNGNDARRKYGSKRFAKWCDSVVKLKRICEDDAVSENFLWMYDDTFIVRPFSIREISIPRAGGVLHAGDLNQPAKRKWREVLRRTAKDLVDRGRPQRNYSTHYPVVYNKTLLRQTLEEFDVPQCPRVIESLYMNHHSEIEARRALEVFQYRKQVQAGWMWRDDVSVVNVGGFNSHVQRLVQPRFGETCRWESAV